MRYGESTSPEVERVAAAIFDASFKVHRKFGPGLLESIYETCLAYELRKAGLRVERQILVPVIYDGVKLDAGLRLDLLVEDCVIVEVKAVEKHHPVFEAQLITYLKLTGLQLGLLINFNVTLLKDGIKRIISATICSAMRFPMPSEWKAVAPNLTYPCLLTSRRRVVAVNPSIAETS